MENKDLMKLLEDLFPEDVAEEAWEKMHDLGKDAPFSFKGAVIMLNKIREEKDKKLKEVMLLMLGSTLTLHTLGVLHNPNNKLTYSEFFWILK